MQWSFQLLPHDAFDCYLVLIPRRICNHYTRTLCTPSYGDCSHGSLRLATFYEKTVSAALEASTVLLTSGGFVQRSLRESYVTSGGVR